MRLTDKNMSPPLTTTIPSTIASGSLRKSQQLSQLAALPALR
jgi:hypothetical protein